MLINMKELLELAQKISLQYLHSILVVDKF